MKELIEELNKLNDIKLGIVAIVVLAMLKERDNKYKEEQKENK